MAVGSRLQIRRPLDFHLLHIGRMRWLAGELLFHFLILCQPSRQLPATHPLRWAVDVVNESGPFIGLVMAYPPEADAVRSSGEFVPRSDVPSLDLYGRRFNIGRIRDVDIIFVMSGQRRLNAGITVQMLLDLFDVHGVVHFGTAGSTNDSLSFGDVSVPNFIAYTGSWTWTKYGSSEEEEEEEISGGSLSFGAYNIPSKGENLLSRIKFKPEELYSAGNSMEQRFWFPVNSKWFGIAEQLKEMEMRRCWNATFCLPDRPKVVLGLKASTADVFVDNAAYRKFILDEFGASTVDEESAAVVMTAMAGGVAVIVFRGVADLAGGEGTWWSSSSLSSLASENALRVAVEFIGALGKEKRSSSSWR